MMKEKIKNNKKYIKETILLLLGGIIINLACFLMGTIYSHAETPTNYYPVSSGQNNMQVLSLEQIFYECNLLATYDFSTVNYVIFIDDISTPSYPYGRKYNVLVWEKALNENPFYIELDYGGTYFEFHKVSNTASTFSYRVYSFQDWTGDLSDVNDTAVYYSERLNYLNGDSPLYRNNCDYVFNTSVYLNQPDNIISPVLQYIDNGINIGDFVDLPGLDEILNNINNTWVPPSNITGHALPNQPTENPNNNDFQNRLQMFDYLKDSINAIVGNLGYNLKNWIDNLTGKMVEGFNSVSQNIWNGFKTLMDNIKDYFGPKLDAIIEKFNYITEPFDSQELANNLNNGEFTSDFLGLITTVSTFANTFTSAAEPQSCSFTLDLRNNGYFSFGLLTFSFDWILPFRSTIRLILGCLCVYSLIVSIFTSINTYIGGTSSINDDI